MITRRALQLSAPTLLVLLNIFLFAPFAIYSGNVDEFMLGFATLGSAYFYPAIVLFVVITAGGLLLPKRVFVPFVAVMFAGGILLWAQGNLVVWDYGLIGKEDIPWADYRWRGLLDSPLWLAGLAVAGWQSRKFVRFSTLGSLALIAVQGLQVGVESARKPQLWSDSEEAAQGVNAPPAIFEFAPENNIIQIVMDELQSDVFSEVLVEEDEKDYFTIFEGFTFFDETLGAFPTTIMSMPAYLSGQTYTNDIPFNDFIEGVMTGKTITNVAYENGYEVDIADTVGAYDLGDFTNHFHIPVSYGVGGTEHRIAGSKMLLVLALFRSMPHFLKSRVNGQIFSLNAGLPPDVSSGSQEDWQAGRQLAHRDFLQDLIDNARVGDRQKVYKLIHLNTTHWPAVLRGGCAYGGLLPWNWSNIRVQVKCSVDHLTEFIEKLKELEIYDDALIIIHADHGYWHVSGSLDRIRLTNMGEEILGRYQSEEYFAEMVSASAPLLAIKPPGQNGPLTINSVLSSLTDLPATISGILGFEEDFPGMSVFDLEPGVPRSREFTYYDRLNYPGDLYFDHIYQYQVDGSLFDANSWNLGGENLLTPSRVDFGTQGARRFYGNGWSGGETDPTDGTTYNWALGESASLRLPIQREQTVNLSATMKTLEFGTPQIITVRVDGNEVALWNLTTNWEWETHNVTLEPDKESPVISTVEFLFSIYRQPDESESRPLAVLFQSLDISVE